MRTIIRNIIIETKKNKAMETNNLGTKKINGTQKNIDESKGKNVSHDKELKDSKLNKEVVTDADGNKKIVDRARNENEDIKTKPSNTTPKNPNVNRGVISDEEAKKTVENKDRNSDITPNRYPNSNPESHKDRGNMKLDEDE
ncbi:hypothetical protein [Flavobacterium panacagri]|uniref:hypothetical protein n=1 Tax=Flavobacterium panacagri TaxID=3034146 RepID=UPI0025A6380D|nr:hypothetical protein [Flavobacterium panacagri]